ncbi:MAG: hypothetical protein JST63_14920 [Bacteroidetes bacterium]|nr:hypothetical protein [Bacteroidota bacterium]
MSKQVTKEDLRFIEFWQEQRTGSKLKYYILYTIAYGAIVGLFTFFIVIFLGGISIIPIAQDNGKVAVIVLLGLLAGFAIAFTGRYINEKRYQKILRKAREN